jgi:LemA protein
VKKNYTPMIAVGATLAIVGFLAIWVIGNLNSLVGMKEDVNESWGKVEVQYERRVSLIGNLVNSVKGSQVQEQKVFGDIANARKQYQSASDTNGKVAAANQIDTAISILPRLQEAYPELKSNENMQKLMAELAGTENQIAGVRDGYNKVATNYNKGIQKFPKSIFASMGGYERRELFKSKAGAENAPEVKF